MTDRTTQCHFCCWFFFVSLLYDCHFFLFILFLFRYLIITYFFLIPQIHIPKIEMPKRKYDDKYLDYGFTFVEGRNEQLDYEGLLFHTAVRWLSKGDMLNLLVHLLPEVTQFLEERNKGDLKAAVSDEAFQCRLAFLADMFSHLNELNRKLQGADSDIIGHRDKVNAFVSKLELWRGKFETGRSATAFPTLARISETAGGVSDVLKNEAIIHLNRLLDEFQHYFPDFKSNNPTIEFTRDPFSFRVDNFPKEAEDIEDQFLDLVHDSAAKAVFAEKSLNAF